MRDIKSGAKVNERFRTSENIEKLSVNEMLVTFLFVDDNFITVMNNENFEQSLLIRISFQEIKIFSLMAFNLLLT